jgi:hypothetical protein
MSGMGEFAGEKKSSMGEESPGTPATADGLGTTGNLNDAAMRDGTERTAAADAAVEEEAVKAAAEAAAREEEMRQERLRAEMEARRQAEEHARAEREREPEWVLGAFMTFGTLKEAQQLTVELGLVSPDRLSRLAWMDEREVEPGTRSQRSWFFNAKENRSRGRGHGSGCSSCVCQDAKREDVEVLSGRATQGRERSEGGANVAASNRASWGARAGFAKLEQAERLLVAGRGAKANVCAGSGQGGGKRGCSSGVGGV